MPARSPISILNKASICDLQTYPYPHLVIQNALDTSTYAKLDQHYPDSHIIRNSTEVLNRHQIQAKDALVRDEIHPFWKEFISYHTSQAFYLELLTYFQGAIHEHYPWLESSMGKTLQDVSVGIRDPQLEYLPDICFDCQPGLNTVQTEKASVRSPHLDARNKLITGLFYMKSAQDSSQGGDLELYEYTTEHPEFSSKSTPSPKSIQCARTIQYRANTVVFFLNTPRSVHGVSARDVTDIPRRLVNFIAGMYALPEKELYSQPGRLTT